MKIGGAIILGVFALLLFLSMKSQPSENVEKLRWLYQANPIEDAEAAHQQGNYSVKCVLGYTLVCPKANSLFKTEIIEGTSDALDSDEHFKLNLKANQYAEAYNLHIMKLNQNDKTQ
ncbi:MAG: hypothetical protein ACI8XV_003104 [Arenicella sp.]|jgi:hypothetical protein